MPDLDKKFCMEFQKLCADYADQEMILYDTGNDFSKITYKDALCRCRQYLKLFEQSGVHTGDTIVTILPNSPEAILCFFASALGGINYAPLPCSVSEREYKNWINLVKPKLIIKKREIANYQSDILTIECDANGDLSWLPCNGMEIGEPNSARVYLMTSGTTGTPKAMSINVDKLWCSGEAFAEFYKIEQSHYRFWNYLPMSYLGGLYNLAIIPLCCKGSFVISEPFSGKTVLNYWSFVKKHSISALWLVPSIVYGLLKIYELAGGKGNTNIGVKIAFLGTAPIQLFQKQQFEEAFQIRLYENFALSETTFLTAETEDAVRFREQSSVGKVLPYVQMKLVPVSADNAACTIWVKTPFLFDGYLSNEHTLDLQLDKDGFFNTKDLGRINEDGALVLCGRNRDIIKKGGLFVSLTEVESVVRQLSYVADAAAVPVPHDFYGESYVLFVIFRNGEDLTEKLHIWMIENFVSYKLPEKIVMCMDFPRTMTGKIQKNKLAEQFKESGDHEQMA